MTTRQELKKQVKLVERLEQLESLADCSMGMDITGYSKTSFDLTGNYTGEPTIESQLNEIARKHFQAMIHEQIACVKTHFTIDLQDKDK